MKILLVALIFAFVGSTGHCQTIDKKFFTVAAFHAGALALDGYSTMQFSHTNRCYEVANPWLYGRHPTAQRLSLTMGAEFAAGIAAAYVLKKHHSPIPWFLPQLGLVASHLDGGISNLEDCH